MSEILVFVIWGLFLALVAAVGFHLWARGQRRKAEEKLQRDRERYDTRINAMYGGGRKILKVPPRTSGHVPPRPAPQYPRATPPVRSARATKAASEEDYPPASMFGLGAGTAEPFRYSDWTPPAEHYSGHGGSSGGAGASSSWGDSSSSSNSSSSDCGSSSSDSGSSSSGGDSGSY